MSPFLPKALTAVGTTSAVAFLVLSHFHHACQYCPLNSYHTMLRLTPATLTIVRNGADDLQIPLPPAAQPITADFTVQADVVVDRPLPLNNNGPIDPVRNPPTPDQIAAAGPERAVTVRLTAPREKSLQLWPAAPATPRYTSPIKVEAMPEPLARSLLIIVGDEVARLSGDATLAPAIAAGGTLPPPLSYWRKSNSYSYLIWLGVGAILLSGLLRKLDAPPTIRTQANAGEGPPNS